MSHACHSDEHRRASTPTPLSWQAETVDSTPYHDPHIVPSPPTTVSSGASSEIGFTPRQETVIACRLSVQSLDTLMENDVQWNHHPAWKGVTHVIFDALALSADLKIVMGQWKRRVQWNYLESGILGNPYTYFPIVKSLNIPVVFSLQDFGDVEKVADMMAEYASADHDDRLLPSLRQLVQRHGLTCLEVDIGFLQAVYSYYEAYGKVESFKERVMGLGARLWVSYSANQPYYTNRRPPVLDEVMKLCCDRVVLKSYGFLRFNRLPTSHGVYQSMTVHPESALRHFETRYKRLCEETEPAKILMDIDTQGVEYLVSRTYSVNGFRLIPLKKIMADKQFGENDYDETYDSVNQCCLLRFRQERRIVSYDNASVRAAKLAFLKSHGLGAVVGLPEHDLMFGHVGSLLADVRAAMLN